MYSWYNTVFVIYFYNFFNTLKKRHLAVTGTKVIISVAMTRVQVSLIFTNHP